MLLSTCGDVCKRLSRCGDVGANCSNQLARRALDESLERLQVRKRLERTPAFSCARGWSQLLQLGGACRSSTQLLQHKHTFRQSSCMCEVYAGMWVGGAVVATSHRGRGSSCKVTSLTCLQAVPCKQGTLRFQGSVALPPTYHTSVYLQPIAQIQGVQRGWRHKWSSLWKE